jgi:hypothetical protein
MRWILTFFIFIGSTFCINAQNIKGIWRGSFEQRALDPIYGKFSKEAYRYEVQLNQINNNRIEGVTYSYLSTIFYGKAELKGIFDKKNKSLTIKETVMLDMKSAGKSEGCLMTCYLDYSKNGKIETLIGTYTSINMKTKADCGYGTVYLEKVTESDFELEDFLKKDATKNLKKSEKAIVTFPRKMSPNNANNSKPNILITEEPIKKTIAQNKKTNNLPKPNVPLISKKYSTENKETGNSKIINDQKVEESVSTETNINKGEITQVEPKIIPAPFVKELKERENKLATTIYIDSKDVNIEFYDNGEIDNDSISVFLDNKIVIDNQRLSTRPITLNLHFDEKNTFYELITVAENLGDIPPNTALMVINYGKKRQEVFLTSDEKRNAKVILEYKPPK